jgi:protein ImuA
MTKAEILVQLQREILPLQGFKPALHSTALDQSLGSIRDAFPNQTFPLGALHEFVSDSNEAAAAACGFIGALVSSLLQNEGMILWIPGTQPIYPPALKGFGLSPEKIIFLNNICEKEILWAMEEALRCTGLTAVVGEIPHLDFTTSRRLQLAVEQSKVTGFITRNHVKHPGTTATLTRWRILPLPSEPVDGLPGVGFPRWQVDLLKVRNGRPGSWQVEWAEGAFRLVDVRATEEVRRKRA